MTTNLSKLVIFMVVLQGLLIVGSFGVPLNAIYATDTHAITHIRFAIGLSLSLLLFQASALYMRALKNFKKVYRPAYRYIAYGMLITGVGIFIIPCGELTGLYTNEWYEFAYLFPGFISTWLVYIGLRKFDTLTSPESHRLPIKIVILATLCISLLANALPSRAANADTLSYELIVSMRASMMILALLCFFIILSITRNISGIYKKSFKYLAVASLLYVISLSSTQALDLIGNDNSIYQYRVYWFPYILMAVGFVASAYLLNSDDPREGSVFKLKRREKLDFEPNSIDVIGYAASLVAEPKNTEYLDRVREITASVGSVDEMTEDDQRTLMKIYIDIEHYITTPESTIDLSQSELRHIIEDVFNITRSNPQKTFWHMLNNKPQESNHTN